MKIVVSLAVFGGERKIRHKDEVGMIPSRMIILMMMTSVVWEQQMKGRHAFHLSSTATTTVATIEGSPTTSTVEESWMDDIVSILVYRHPTKGYEESGGNDDDDNNNTYDA
jgi:hypothetical protein